MKNVLILSSSPRRGGNSDTLCDEFMQGAIESGHRVEKVFLRDKTIHPCTGCGVCSQYKKPCPQKDDAAEIIGKMLAADVIVMATPVYFYAMSAQMKTLIDRCCGPYTEMKTRSFTSSPRPLKTITASWIALWPTLWDSSTVWRTRP
ncbi:hypothetical protein HMPREF1002_00593 [Porphyromonas sp. 31_2]|nr:hypothetical protein HMPREF1002_00593 [Porphyromonas sp. 31_2]